MSSLALGRERTIELVYALALAILLVFALYQSWGMWFDPVADTGRDLYIPERIAAGDFKLYRDVSYLYPPFAPYLLAVIVAVFGSTFGVMTWVGISSSLLLALMLYLIGRQWSGALAGVLLAFLFISVHMTGVSGYSFNFIFPYAHSAVFGLLFLLLFLYALMRYAVDQDSLRWLWLALAAGSIGGWSKIEYAATFLIVLAASFIVRRPKLTAIAAAAAGNIGILAMLNWYFSDAPPERHWLTMNILPESLLSGSVAAKFYDRIQGLDQPVVNLRIALSGALMIAGAVVCLAGIDRLRKSGGAVRMIGVPLLAVVFIAIQYGLAQQYLFFRGWFLIQLVLIPLAIRDRKRSPLLLLLLFSLLLGSRVLLRLEPTRYGFLFAIPAEIVFVYVLFADLPRRQIYCKVLAIAWIPLFVLLGVSSLANQRYVYERRKDNVVTTPRGIYRDRLADRALILNDLLRFLERRRPESMAVIPEGLALNWITGVDSSIPYHTLSPAEIPDRASQQTVMKALEESPPEIILLIQREYGEYGYRGIGVDYGKELIDRVNCLYESTVSREGQRFFFVVMERTPNPECVRN